MRPDLSRVYRGSVKPKRAVILIPGVFGSRLRDVKTGRVVWGRAASFFERLYRPFDPDADLLDLPISAPDPLQNRDLLEPAGIFDKVAGHEYYILVLNTLRDAGGYTLGDIRNPHAGEDLFAFDYDWRRDAAETAGLLARAVDRVLQARGEPGGRVDLVGHSLGGLIARYYVRHGGRDLLGGESFPPTFEGAAHVGTVVFLGTPNEGTLGALKSLVEGEHVARLLAPEAIFTMPAAYELLPRSVPGLLLDGSGSPLPNDILDVDTWEKFGWSVFGPRSRLELRKKLSKKRSPAEADRLVAERMEASRKFAAWALLRARRFRSSLEGDEDHEPAVKYVAFGGDCLETPARAVVLFDGKEHKTFFDPEDLPAELRTPELRDLILEPGDGTVTRLSLLGLGPAGGTQRPPTLPLASSWFLCETHRMITQNISFLDNLLHVLLQPQS